MQATIERETTTVISTHRIANESIHTMAGNAYKAPLATLLVLVASARASAPASDEVGTGHRSPGSSDYS